MRISELLAYLRANVPFNYVAEEFSATADQNFGDEYAVVKLTGGYPPDREIPKYYPSFQVLVRGKKNGQAQAEAKANEIYDHFHRRSGFFIGLNRVGFCSADQSTPIFLGLDDNKRPIYSINFTLTIIRGNV